MQKLSWPVLGVVAGLVLVLGGCGSVSAAHDDPSSSSAPASPGSSNAGLGPGYAANRAAAQRAAQRALDVVTLPPASAPQQRSPISALEEPFVGVAPIDTSLTRTTWWTVPAEPEAVADWLRHHAPSGFRFDGSGSSVTADGSTRIESIEWVARHGADAYTTPSLAAGWTSMPGGTAVRFDVFLAARQPRTSQMLIPPDVTDVRISRTTTPAGHRPLTVRSDVPSPTRLVEAINALPGVAVTNTSGTGIYVGDTRTYRVRFTWPGHTMLARFDNWFPNGSALTLTLDGQRLEPDLQPDHDLVGLVDELLQEP